MNSILLRLFLCITLMIPSPLFANKYMDGAKEVVQSLEERANVVVDQLIINDVSNAIKLASFEAVKSSDYEQALNLAFESAKTMELQYDKFLLEPQAEYVTTKKSVEESINNYAALYKKQMDMSWFVSDVTSQRQTSVGLIKMALGNLQQTCLEGRFDSSENVGIMLSSELPSYEFSLRTTFNSNIPLNLLDYKGLTYHHDEEILQVMYDAGQIGLMASGLVFSAGVSAGLNALIFDTTAKGSWAVFKGGFASGTPGAFSSGLLAATPYIIAAVVVMMAVTHFVNRRKYEKIKRQRVAAEFYKFNNTQRSQWVVNEYKERCGEVVDSLKPVIADLDIIEKNVNSPEAIFSYYKPEIAKLEKTNQDWEIYASASCKVQLHENYNNKKCADYKNQNESSTSCAYNEKTLVGNGCFINFDENGKLIDSDIEGFQKIISEYTSEEHDQLNDADTKVSVLRYLIFKSFASNFSEVTQSLYSKINTVLDKKRKTAFQRLLQLAGTYNQSITNQNQVLLYEKSEAEGMVFEFEGEYQEIVSEAISVVFEKSPPSLLYKNFLDFQGRFEKFHEDHLYLPESINLNIRLKKLKNILLMEI